MIDPSTIQLILETARIEEVVGEFVYLKKRGVNLIGLCPFHNEKTPSFTVSPAKNLFKCFGCGKGGNSLKFIMEHEKFTYTEAIRFLAAKYHIEIEEKEMTPEEREAQNEKESLMAVTAFASQFFTDQLHHSEKGQAIGLTYFKERGFQTEIIRKFQLGYDPDEKDTFSKHALNQGYQLPLLEKSGLTLVREQETIDRFRGRVIFPIHSLSGRVIAFGGRILSSESSKAKYINSPESDIYHKSASLYGIYFARNAILAKDECYLVEGYTDVISMHQAGIENVVASSGTSLTTDQIKLIKRFTNKITILYDGDEAGIKASFRGIDMILEEGLQVKIVLFPQGEDPDSFVRKHRQVEVIEFLQDQAKNFILFKTSLLLKEAASDPIKRSQLVREIVQSVALIPDPISRNIYLKECADLMNITEQTLVNELNRILRKNFNKRNLEQLGGPLEDIPEVPVQTETQHKIEFSESEFQEKDIIRLLLNYGREEITIHGGDPDNAFVSVVVAPFIIHELVHDEITFTNPLYQEIFNEFFLKGKEGEIPDEQYFIQHSSDAVAQLVIDLVSSPYTLSSNWMDKKKIAVQTEKQVLPDAVTSSVLSFKLRRVEKTISENQKLLKKELPEDESQQLLKDQQVLTQIKKVISEKLGRIITR